MSTILWLWGLRKNKIFQVGLILLSVALIFAVIYAKGYTDSNKSWVESIKTYSWIKNLERDRINESVGNLDNRAKCLELGGLLADCNNLPRLGPAP